MYENNIYHREYIISNNANCIFYIKFINYSLSIVFMVTTIQLNENVKRELDKLKKDKETYEDVILGLMNIAEKHKREQIDLMIEGAKETAEESLKITKEFESIDEDFDWEWKDGN